MRDEGRTEMSRESEEGRSLGDMNEAGQTEMEAIETCGWMLERRQL